MSDKPQYFTAWGPDGRSVVTVDYQLEPWMLCGECEEDEVERRPWTVEEDALVVQERGRLQPTLHREIAARLGRSKGACEQRWSMLRRRFGLLRGAAE